MPEKTDFEKWCDIIARTPGKRREPEEAPKDGSICRFQVMLELQAFWCDENKRWVLTQPLNLEYLPTKADHMPVTQLRQKPVPGSYAHMFPEDVSGPYEIDGDDYEAAKLRDRT